MKTADHLKTDHNIIWLQDEGINDNWEGVTWCMDKIDETDTKFIKASFIKQLIDKFEDKLNLCLEIDEDGDKCHECNDTRDLITELKNKLKE